VCLSYFNNSGEIVTIFELADLDMLRYDTVRAVDNLWNRIFDYLNVHRLTKSIIFCHNLGSFDGYYIYKALFRYCNYNAINTIIDGDNKFIQITGNLASQLTSVASLDGDQNPNIYTWKDSMRIFNVSLKELCKVFGVEGKHQIIIWPLMILKCWKEKRF
jgi:hypothetical protein